MKAFGLTKTEIDIVKTTIAEIFGENTDLKVFLFGSRATGKNKKFSDIDLAFKSKADNLDQKITLVKEKLEASSVPIKFDLVNWDTIIKEYLPEIKKQKVPFWDKNEFKRTSPWRICPLGEHWVSRHTKDLKSGKFTDHDGHCRKNKGKKDVLNSDEIQLISQSEKFLSVPIKASLASLGFKTNENSFDHLINGWCAYWNDILKPVDPIHPNHVKALMASESGFKINPKRTKTHTAIGLMQIMPVTIRLLSQSSKELKDHYIEISKTEAFDPNINICASIRWLFRKYELVKRKRKDARWIDVLEEYKGITIQVGPKSSKIRTTIHSYLAKLK